MKETYRVGRSNGGGLGGQEFFAYGIRLSNERNLPRWAEQRWRPGGGRGFCIVWVLDYRLLIFLNYIFYIFFLPYTGMPFSVSV